VTAIQLASWFRRCRTGKLAWSRNVPRTVEENSQFKMRCDAKINCRRHEAWKRMVPGMMARSFGFRKESYRPSKTVAADRNLHRTGFVLGLFTSMLGVNPRLAVVVTTRGTDAHGHLPAAVAGNILPGPESALGT